MKWIYRLSSLVILMAALSLPFYANYKSEGKLLDLDAMSDKLVSLFTPSSAEIEGSPAAHRSKPSNFGTSDPQSITVYRWQDEHGQWHFSDQAPEGESEETHIDPDTLPTISAMDQSLIDKTSSPAKGAEPKLPMDSDPTQLNFDNMANVLEQAKEAANAMNERNQALNHIVNDANQ